MKNGEGEAHLVAFLVSLSASLPPISLDLFSPLCLSSLLSFSTDTHFFSCSIHPDTFPLPPAPISSPPRCQVWLSSLCCGRWGHKNSGRDRRRAGRQGVCFMSVWLIITRKSEQLLCKLCAHTETGINLVPVVTCVGVLNSANLWPKRWRRRFLSHT